MYKHVYFEISGICNAHCNYCVNGKDSISGLTHKTKSSLIDVETFYKAIDHMLNQKIISQDSIIHLYNWGEPFLHPKLKDILAFLHKKFLSFGLSTNISKPVTFSKNELALLEHITFSMPGFSQHSYDKIHKFNFEQIKNNIESMITNFRESGFKGSATIAYHLYKFNIDEIQSAQEFAKKNNISIHFSSAYFNGFSMFKKYLNGELDFETLKKIKSELFIEHIQEFQSKRPKDYYCPQFNYLTIDENCNILPCCAMEKNCPDYNYIGSVFELDQNTLRSKKRSHPLCHDCQNLSIDFLGHNSIGINELKEQHNKAIESVVLEVCRLLDAGKKIEAFEYYASERPNIQLSNEIDKIDSLINSIH